MAATIALYIPVTLLVTDYRGKARKQMNKLDNDKTQRAMDMLLCVEAVKSFGMEDRELQSFASAIDKFQVGFQCSVVFVQRLTSMVASICPHALLHLQCYHPSKF